MIKKFYVLAWFLLIGSALTSIVTGTFDALGMVAVSIGTVGLVYALALWAAFTSPHSAGTE
jgi:hypothetical protein